MKKEIKKDIINSQLISYGPWKVRRKHTSIIWNNFIYLFGGFNGGNSISDSFYCYYYYYSTSSSSSY